MRAKAVPLLIMLGTILIAAVWTSTPVWSADQRPPIPWEKFHHDHPRLFFNQAILEEVRARIEDGLNHDFYQEHLEWAESEYPKELEVGDYGQDAAIIAFIYLINHDPRALEAAKKTIETLN